MCAAGGSRRRYSSRQCDAGPRGPRSIKHLEVCSSSWHREELICSSMRHHQISSRLCSSGPSSWWTSLYKGTSVGLCSCEAQLKQPSLRAGLTGAPTTICLEVRLALLSGRAPSSICLQVLCWLFQAHIPTTFHRYRFPLFPRLTQVFLLLVIPQHIFFHLHHFVIPFPVFPTPSPIPPSQLLQQTPQLSEQREALEQLVGDGAATAALMEVDYNHPVPRANGEGSAAFKAARLCLRRP